MFESIYFFICLLIYQAIHIDGRVFQMLSAPCTCFATNCLVAFLSPNAIVDCFEIICWTCEISHVKQKLPFSNACLCASSFCILVGNEWIYCLLRDNSWYLTNNSSCNSAFATKITIIFLNEKIILNQVRKISCIVKIFSSCIC